jgi:sporulation protein YlmC with PRC-barrel domain
MQRLGTAFNGFAIEASDGKVGNVSDILFDDKTWALRWLVVDTGTWLAGRKILLHPSSLAKPDIEGRAFEATLTKAQVEKSPEIDSDQPVSLQMEAGLYSYYGYEPLLAGGFYEGKTLVSPPGEPPRFKDTAVGAPDGKAAESHLRSIAEVQGYAIHALDGNIGHLEDFLIDDESWFIRYFVVDTKNFWFGKHVVVPPNSIKEISWAERYVRLDLTCYKIKGSPPWNPTGVIDRAYEALLQTYYGWAKAEGKTASNGESSAAKPAHAIAPTA